MNLAKFLRTLPEYYLRQEKRNLKKTTTTTTTTTTAATTQTHKKTNTVNKEVVEPCRTSMIELFCENS